MLKSFIISIMVMFLLFFMILMNMMLKKKMFLSREKMSPFECGFDPMSANRLPFSLSFYLISIIFLIFDVEISLIIPMVKIDMYMYMYVWMNELIILLVLVVGLVLEWVEGALKWMN